MSVQVAAQLKLFAEAEFRKALVTKVAIVLNAVVVASTQNVNLAGKFAAIASIFCTIRVRVEFICAKGGL